VRGDTLEGRRWMAELLEQTENHRPQAPGATGEPRLSEPMTSGTRLAVRQATRAEALIAAANMALVDQDHPPARAYWEESLAIGRELQDRTIIARSLSGICVLAFSHGNAGAADRLREEVLPIWRELKDREGLASSLVSMGFAALGQADDAQARGFFAEA